MGRQRATTQQQKGKQVPSDWRFSYSRNSKPKGKKGKSRGY